MRTRVVYSGALLVWAVASFLAAAVNSIGALFGPRLLLGVGEAPFIPAAMRTLSDWLPRSERGMGASVLTSGIALGSAVGPPLLGLLVSGYGWRSCFVATGVLSLLVAVLWYVWYRHPSEDPSSPRRGMSALNARKIVLTTGMVAALAILGTAFASSATVAIICLSISTSGIIFADGAALAATQDVARQLNLPGSAAGFVNTFGNLGGILGPIVTGALA